MRVPKAWRIACILLTLALVTFAIYSPTLRNGFVNWDDNFYVTENPQVNSGLTREGFWWALTLDPVQWHPLTWLSLQLDWQVFRGQAWGFHLVNTLLHVANSVLLLLVLRDFTGSLWPSVVTALFFALHPLQVQSVAWVTERKNVLATLFWLLAMIAYLRYVRRPSLIRYVCVCTAMGLGLLAKSTLVTLPFVLLLFDFWPLRRFHFGVRGVETDQQRKTESWLDSNLGLIVEKLPLLALAVIASYLTYKNRELHHYVVSSDKLPVSYRLGYALIYYCEYLSKVFWPVDLSCFYPHERSAPPAWQVLAAINLLASITAVVVWQAARRPYLIVGWLWFLGTLAPSIGLVQVGEQSIADHFVYIQLVGIFTMLAWAACELAAWRPATKLLVLPVVTAAVMACGVMSYRQTRVWHDSVSLWQQAARVTDYDYYVCRFLSQAYLEQQMIPEAIDVYERGIERSPYNAQLRIWYAELLRSLGEFEAADAQEEITRRLLPSRR